MKQHSQSHSKKNHEHHEQASQLDAYLTETYQLSVQLKRYKDDMIHLTLQHKDTLQKLNKSLKKQCQMQQIIERKTNQLSVEQSKYKLLQEEFNCIQANYKALFDKSYTTKVVTFDEILLKENQMVIQLSDLKTQNSKNGANFYQQIINIKNLNLKTLNDENQKLNNQIMLNSEFYKEQLDKLQEQNFFLKSKINRFQHVKDLIRTTNNKNGDLYQKQENQLIFQHLQSKMSVLQKLNQDLIARNNQLNKQNLKMIKQNKDLKKQIKKYQQYQWKLQLSEFEELLNQNKELKKIINNGNFQNEQENQHDSFKLIKEEALRQKTIAQYQTKIKLLEKQLNDIGINMKKLKQSKEDDEQRNSLLMKRWNEIFIRMNPYFDIYKYTDLNLDEREWIFFDQHKDYKTLKQYQNKVYISQKKNNDLQNKLKDAETRHHIQMQTKDAVILSLQSYHQTFQTEIQKLSNLNTVLTERIRQLQEQIQEHQNRKKHKKVHLTIQNQNKSVQKKSKPVQNENNQESSSSSCSQNSNQQSSNSSNLEEQQQKISEINLGPGKITIDLLRQMIDKQNSQKNELINILKQRDMTIIQLHTELYQSLESINIEVLGCKYHNINQLSSKVQIHQSLSNSILDSVTANQTQILQHIKSQELKVLELRQSYKNQIASLQNYYQNKIQTISSTIYKWEKHYKDIYSELALLKIQTACEKSRFNQKEKIDKENQLNAQMDLFNHQERINSSKMINQNEENQFQHFIQQNNPKIIGDGTVHHLATTLKNYQNQNNKTLETITKIREQFQHMKSTVNKVEQLVHKNNQLNNQLNIKNDENQRLKTQNQELERIIISLENRLNLKQGQIQQIFESISAKQIDQLQKKNEQLNQHNEKLTIQLVQLKENLLDQKPENAKQSVHEANLKSDQLNLMSNDQYQLIFELHAKKNKQHLNEVEKNKKLKEKVKNLQEKIEDIRKNQRIQENGLTHLQMEQYEKMKDIFTNQNILQTLRKANETITKKSKECQFLKAKLSQERLHRDRIDFQEEQQEAKMNQ